MDVDASPDDGAHSSGATCAHQIRVTCADGEVALCARFLQSSSETLNNLLEDIGVMAGEDIVIPLAMVSMTDLLQILAWVRDDLEHRYTYAAEHLAACDHELETAVLTRTPPDIIKAERVFAQAARNVSALDAAREAFPSDTRCTSLPADVLLHATPADMMAADFDRWIRFTNVAVGFLDTPLSAMIISATTEDMLGRTPDELRVRYNQPDDISPEEKARAKLHLATHVTD